MGEIQGRMKNGILWPVKLFFVFFLSLQFSNTFSQCEAVIGSNLSVLNGCEVFTVQFTDLSSNVVSRTWNFGDGSELSYAQNPVHSFNAGIGDTTYTVTLTITCSSGTSVAQRTVNVYAKPTVDFSADKSSVCAITDSICMDNFSDYHTDNTYYWNFGDGTVSSEFEPCKVYSTPGTYTVTQTVTNQHGCLDSYTIDEFMRVEPVPSTAFIVSSYSGCVPFTVSFDNITDTIGDAYSNWSWDFGDGSDITTEFETEAHTFDKPGEYTVKLGATNNLGCYNYSTQKITVSPSPVAKFSTTSPDCENDYTYIEFTGSYNSSPEFIWGFDTAIIVNGSGSGPYNVKWATAGNKDITLTINEDGCSSSYTEKVQVTPIAKVFLEISASQDSICANQAVAFTAMPKNFANYSFYKNANLMQSSPLNVYETSELVDGDIIYVGITDINGCTDIVSDTFEIYVKPTPGISLTDNTLNDTACVNDPLIFTASPANYDEYTFMVNNVPLQTSESNIFESSTLKDRDRVTVVAINNECPSPLSNVRKITIWDALPPPQVYCGASTPNTVNFAWDPVNDAIGYEVSIDNGAFETPSSGNLGLAHQIGGLTENQLYTIRVRTIDDFTCGIEVASEVVTCEARTCPEILFDQTEPQRDVCESELVELTIKNINISDYTVVWAGNSASLDTTFMFIADTSTSIPVIVQNNDQPLCPSVKKTFDVIVTPRIDLSITSSANNNTACGDDAVSFTVLPQYFDNYELYDNGKMIKSGYENILTINNAANGHYFYATTLDEACVQMSDTIQMTIIEPLNPRVVNFESSTENSITFRWNAVPGATGYIVSRDNGTFIVPSSGSTGLTHTVSPLDPGDAVSITVIALGDGLCGNSDISQPAIGYAETCNAISYNITDKFIICEGDSIELIVKDLSIPNYSIKWGSLPPSRSKSTWVVPKNDTVIFVTVKNTDQPFCAGVNSYVSVKATEIPPPLTLTSSESDNIACIGDLVKISATPGGYDSYEFYDYSKQLQKGGFNSLNIIALNDEYNVRARATHNGCVGEFSPILKTSVIPLLKEPQVNCGVTTGSSVSFLWDSVPEAVGYSISINNQQYETASSGYTGLLHEITGLSAEDAVTIEVMALGSSICSNSIPSQEVTCYARDCGIINFGLDPYHEICADEEIALTVESITVSNYSLSWNNAPYGNVTTTQYTGLSDTIISVRLRDNNQPLCPPASKYFDITVKQIEPVTLSSSSANNTICRGDEMTLTVLPETFEQYIFRNGATVLQDDFLNTLTISGMPAEFTLTADVYQNGCLSTTNQLDISSVVPADLYLTASESGEICRNEQVLFTATPGFTSYFFDNGEFILEEGAENSVELLLNDTLITVSAIDTNNCTSIGLDTIHFSILELPEMSLSCSSDTICFGDYTSYFAYPEGLENYSFYRSTELLQENISNYYATDSLKIGDVITVVGRDSKGCYSKPATTVYPHIMPYPDFTIGSSSEGICMSDSVLLFLETELSMAGYNIYWSTGQNLDTIEVKPVTTTTYRLYYSDGYCNNVNIDNKVILVDSDPPPVAYAGVDVTICINESIELNARGGENYLWRADSTLDNLEIFNPFATPLESTTYYVTVTNTYCKDADSVTIFVDLCIENLTDPVPQIITPNGDGINDQWVIYNIDYFETNSLKIFNRWGNEVYSVSPYLNDWEGKTTKGIDLPEGTYFYVLNLGNGTRSVTGYVIIHR